MIDDEPDLRYVVTKDYEAGGYWAIAIDKDSNDYVAGRGATYNQAKNNARTRYIHRVGKVTVQ